MSACREAIGSLLLALVALAPLSAGANPATHLFTRGQQVFPVAWTGDGSLYVTVVENGGPRIRLISENGEVLRSVEGPVANSWAAALSPSERELLVESYVARVSDLHRVDLATGISARVTSTAWNEWHPSWSPDGRRLSFDSDAHEGVPLIQLLELETGHLSRLTTGTRAEQGARWSPDGRRLAFHRRVGEAGDDNHDVFIIDLASRSEFRLTRDPGDSSSATWSPDGTRIAFSSNKRGSYDLYVACADGSGLERLTDRPADEKYPLWSPDGGRIAYQVETSGVWVIPAPPDRGCQPGPARSSGTGGA
jgi:Tol biopolymer transport system component